MVIRCYNTYSPPLVPLRQVVNKFSNIIWQTFISFTTEPVHSGLDVIDTTLIFKDDQYKQYCKSVSNYSSQWEDLYQEFAKEIWLKRNLVVDNIEGFCKGIIYKLWRSYNGSDTSRKKKGQHMLLANYTDRGYEVGDIQEPIQSETLEIDRHLSALLNSENSKTRRNATIFKACIDDTRAEVARKTGANYATIHTAVKETSETIKHNMTKNEIKTRLLAEGVSSSYSGKDKTFYTSKPVSQDLEATIIKAGFKQCKK